MLAIRAFQQVKVWSRDADRRSAFAAECSAAFSTKVMAVNTAEEAVHGSGVVVTATNAKDPVLSPEWVAPGTHVNAMGSNQARRRELPAELIRRADWIAVDSIEQARMESGDLLMALDENSWADPKIVELKDIVVSKPSRERRPVDITIFKSNGLAVEDVICAGYVYERGIQEGKGAEMRYS
jgi:alanine dehydrogenase